MNSNQKSLKKIILTLFGFTRDKTLCWHVPKDNKAVALYSSVHHTDTVDKTTKKPEIILFNSTKGGVDEIEKNVRIVNEQVASGDFL